MQGLTEVINGKRTHAVAQGDCLDVMQWLPDNSIDTIITDPPYALEFMGKAWDKVLPGVEVWKECLRVAKPGAFLLAFGGTRTFHRLTCFIEDAGWKIRDCIMWLYGSGFPKSYDISKGIDKAKGATREVVGPNPNNIGRKTVSSGGIMNRIERPRENHITKPATPEAELWDGYGTALKPAWEPIIVAMKPYEKGYAHNALTHGVAGLNIEGAKIGVEEITVNRFTDGAKPFGGGAGHDYESTKKEGRWPANVIIDEAAGEMIDDAAGVRSSGAWTGKRNSSKTKNTFGDYKGTDESMHAREASTGGASRFFYCAKASAADRNAGLEYVTLPDKVETCRPKSDSKTERGLVERLHGRKAKNYHATVKPVDLMAYLCELTKTPTGGIILDPFCGSGSTGVAARRQLRPFIGIDEDPVWCDVTRKRIEGDTPLFSRG